MNERLYAVCASLSDEERKRNRGAFFKSIHSTLNHILWADRVWMTRVQPMWTFVTHMFNHQTHHRGQLTTLLSQAGIDYGVTDVLLMPQLE